MKCEKCKSEEASIHFTQIKDGKVVSYNLCKDCAEKHGVKSVKLDSEQQPVFAPETKEEVLSEMLSKGDAVTGECPNCHCRIDDIKRTGRLGCGRCYYAFEKQMDVLLRRIQGSSFHIGQRTSKPEDEIYNDQLRVRDLKKRLNEAVKVENYEEAARLRDEIVVIERKIEEIKK